MSDCKIPMGCIHDEAANACSLCDEDGADRIAEYYAMKLQSCPFCGELPTVRDDAAIVSCRNKSCEVRPAVSRITREAAIAAWNKR